MKLHIIKKVALGMIAAGICLTSSAYRTPQNVWAASVSESADNNTEEGLSAQEEMKENSWRYQEGEVIDKEGRERAAISPNAWNKVNGQYVNSAGEIIQGAQSKGIDVSEHNGYIDWDKVKNAGIDFAVIRCGYGSNFKSQDDAQWLHNVEECERLGIPYGVYLYSYADTVQKAKSEAEHVLRLLKGHTPSYAVYYDLEDDKMTKPLDAKLKGQIAQTFCDTVSASGYKVGIYANLDWWTNQLTDTAFDNPNWSKWVAQYNTKCDYSENYDIWQCTSKGKVNGITGNNGNVDINFWMGNVPGAANLQYDTYSKCWYVYKNGEIDRGYTGMAWNEYGWWYVTNGAVDWNYTGMAQNIYGWWYISNGTVDWNYRGMAQNIYGWWYISNGTVDWNYTGMAQNIYGWWYMTNGAVDWNYRGMAQNMYGWWYISNGTVDWNYRGMAQNMYGWWYISNGTVDWNYTGTVSENETDYFVVNGYAGS